MSQFASCTMCLVVLEHLFVSPSMNLMLGSFSSHWSDLHVVHLIYLLIVHPIQGFGNPWYFFRLFLIAVFSSLRNSHRSFSAAAHRVSGCWTLSGHHCTLLGGFRCWHQCYVCPPVASLLLQLGIWWHRCIWIDSSDLSPNIELTSHHLSKSQSYSAATEIDQGLKSGASNFYSCSNFFGLLPTPSVCIKAMLEHTVVPNPREHLWTVLYCR